MDVLTDEQLARRIQAQMFLAESGWRVRVEEQSFAGKTWEVFYAVHDAWPEQRAVSVTELVRRCAWQETHRTPRPSVTV